ncbi:MAG: tetratricopeptide repeat protein [Planctomycetota bacterium]|jgi:tetratricopeptide (TPR) repeat protein
MVFRRTAFLLLAAAVSLGGCSTTHHRPTDIIRASADRSYEQSDYESAASDYAQIIARYPGDWEAQYRFGLCQLELGDPSAARRALEIAHTRRPRNDDVTDALAEAIYRTGEEDQLFAFLRERAESTQGVPAYLRLAKYAMKISDHDSAKRAYDTAIRLDGGRTVEPYLMAAEFAEEIGHRDLALYRLRQAYGIDPYDERVKDELRAMGEVPGPTIALPPDA